MKKLCILIMLVLASVHADPIERDGIFLDYASHDDVKLSIFGEPGWVANTLPQGGTWTGMPDLDKLKNTLTVNVHLISPSQTPFEETGASQLRNVAVSLLEGRFSFPTPPQKLDQLDALPLLQVKVVILPQGVNYLTQIKLALLEDVSLRRESWAKGFPWQAVTWQKELMFSTRRGQLDDEVKINLKALLTDFLNQISADEALRKDIDNEDAEIKAEYNRDIEDLKKELQK